MRLAKGNGNDGRSRFRKGLRRVVIWLLLLRGSPHAIAMGVAVGVFVAFTPTYGVQMLLAPLIATFLGANRPASIPPVWITNPLTMPACYAFTYWVGTTFWAGPPVDEVYDMMVQTLSRLATFDVWEIFDQFVAFMGMLRDILVPLFIGGVIVGLVAGGISYVVTREALRQYGEFRAQRRQRRRAARAGR
jgi:uncharacterized protein